MTDRHDEWSPEDDEQVRRALMSLMDDVAHEPLPEPAQIRARAEGRAAGGPEVADLDARRSRRRSMTFLAGAAAAVLVAAGAGLVVVNQPSDDPVASSTSDRSTTGSSGSSAAASTLRTLGPSEWEAVLGVPVEDTVQGEPEGHCFRPAKGTTWRSSSARAADDTRLAGQWVGTSPKGSAPLFESVDQSVTDCEGYSQSSSTRGTLAGNGSFRAWRGTGAGQPAVWWVEVSDGVSASFLAITETDDRTYTEDDMRTLARGVLGEVDLTRASSTTTSEGTTADDSSDDSSTADDSPPTTTVTRTAPTDDESSGRPTTTSPGTTTAPTSPSGSETSGGDSTTAPGSPSSTPTTPSPTTPEIGPVPASAYVDGGDWSSQTLTGGRQTVGNELSLDGKGTTIDACSTTADATRAGGLGVRASGDESVFGRQYVLMTDSSADTDQLMSDLVGRYSTDCGGAADTRPLSDSSRVDTFALTKGGGTTYIAVVRQNATSVSIFQITSPSSAPEPLTDATADEELTRLAGLARR